MRRFLGLAALMIGLMAKAVVPADPIFSSYFVEGNNPALIRQLAETFDLERRSGTGYEILVRADRAAELLKFAPQAMLVERDVQDVFRRSDLRAYHDFTSVQQELKDAVQKYPQIATMENYGSSQDGRPQLVLRLTSPTMSQKPEILITSSTHGDELITVELTMSLIQKLVKGYGTDTRITQMLDGHVIYFIPVVSPDGYVHHTRYTNGVDPNRDYPWPNDPNKKSNAALVNEMDWVAKRSLAGSLDIHCNLATVMYPWAYTDQKPSGPELSRFQDITREMAQDTGYNYGQIADVFGIARGSSADYWYWKHKSISLGYEMGGSFLPAARDLPRAFDADTTAIFRFIESF